MANLASQSFKISIIITNKDKQLGRVLCFKKENTLVT